MKKAYTEKELLQVFEKKGFDLQTRQGRMQARKETNRLTGSKWTQTRMIGNALMILETEGGYRFREFHLNP